MSGCLKVLTMHRIARILLDVATIGWIVFVVIAIVAVLQT